jgi:hypothetical protein
MRHLILILAGLIVASGIGYFVGFDHGFERSAATPAPSAYEEATVSDAAATMGKIIGSWRSNDDPAFIRDIRNDGTVVDRYEGSEDSEGLWMVFTKEIPDTAFTGPIEEGAVYLALTMSEDEKLYFKIVKADGESLELIYLNRGGGLSFHRVQ